MLVLTRKLNESIQIGDDIEIKVLAVEGDQIKLGIDAPKAVDIHRKEIYLDIKNQNSEAANLPDDVLSLLKNSER
ncbi:carbon storage regulator CsrA [Virgibacillus kekensis]|uniref:Translational regulator CsrA n=1 Tax=Virgibacillus kekensis TaxID=202261 RepID=A0ABV9DFE2_9BACI